MFVRVSGFRQWKRMRTGRLPAVSMMAALLLLAAGCVPGILGEGQRDLVRLKLYWNEQRGDRLSIATIEGERTATEAGYKLVRTEGCVHSTQAAETVPLKLFWNTPRGDNFITATVDGERAATEAGYQFIRVEGYAYATASRRNTVPLKLYWNPQLGDNFTTSTSAGERDAVNGGYQFVRIEAYVFPSC